MRIRLSRRRKPKHRSRPVLALAAGLANAIAPSLAGAAPKPSVTPIQHVIVIVGEGRGFDHVFATYKPVRGNETILNLLSRGIVRNDGTPGPNYRQARQFEATDTGVYRSAPQKTGLYPVLPPALTGGPSSPYICQAAGGAGGSCATPENIAMARMIENGLSNDYYQYLLTGGVGQPRGVPDARVSYAGEDASHLPNGPYQLTNGGYPYDAFAASPVHRFFQMWQQLDCSAGAAAQNGDFGCHGDLFPWVEVTIGAGSNGKAQPLNFDVASTGEGSTAMGFFNVQNGDAPYLKYLADAYAMSDNFHQGVNGGAGANHIMLGYADAIWFSDGAGHPLAPPNHKLDPYAPDANSSGGSGLSEIENPNPQPGTNNYYIQDGSGGGSGSPTAATPGASYGGGSYVNCADPAQPGVAPILNYLNALPHPTPSRCEKGRYYLVNNYNPGYFGDGSNAYADKDPRNYVFTIPPSSVRHIGDVLNENNVTWAYYGDQFERYLKDKHQTHWGADEQYCAICNWVQYSSSIMTDAGQRAAHMKDTTDLYAAIETGDLPAVAFVKPSGFVDGHPASSKLILFEGFVKKIVDGVMANPNLWNDTAIFVTFSDGGGYWDSGYVQPVDFFGDGTRVPMIVVSKYSTGGHISHTYADHASVAKFIEANWKLPPITGRSRDNLPNPLSSEANPYIPLNSPAIGEMTDMFKFSVKQ